MSVTRLHEWLLREEARTNSHAKAQRAYRGVVGFIRNPLAVLGAVIVVLLMLVAALAPVLATHDPIAQNLQRTLLPPSGEHFFGTDQVGRDVYSRVVHGSRITLYIVFLVTVIVTPVGLLVGAVSGYVGGIVDAILMRITDIFLSFPGLVLALAFVAVLGPNLQNAIIAIALSSWPPIARLARAEALTVRKSDYIAAVKL